MIEHAMITQTRLAISAIEFLRVANFSSAFGALDRSIDELKHTFGKSLSAPMKIYLVCFDRM
jgi:hypothetical protein